MRKLLIRRFGFGIAITFASLAAFLIAFFTYRSIASRATLSLPTSSPIIELFHANVRVDNRVEEALSSSTTPKTDVLIILQKPPQPESVKSRDKTVRKKERVAYVNQLQKNTDSIQKKIKELLATYISSGDIDIKKTFFIENIFFASVTQKGLTALTLTPGVVEIIPDEKLSVPEPLNTSASTEWNLQKIEADRVWNELGITGEGSVVANIDTGVQWDHPALKNAYRGWNGTSEDHSYNWYDPTNTSPTVPLDNNGHGTHTMGTMVGFNGATYIGVAPGAKWIAAKGCESNWCSSSSLLSAAQWLLSPTRLDGSDADSTKAPDVINNSWSSGSCDTWYQGMIDTWRNAGIVPIFSAGNTGPNPQTINSPGDNPSAIAVGATDENDAVAYFSSRGPACAAFGSIIKPDVTAPGYNVYSSLPTNSYGYYSGTSMAAPHVAGAVALLFQAYPDILPYEVAGILKNSAADLGTTGADYAYGHGRINIYNAIQTATSPIPSPTPTSNVTPTPTQPPSFITIIQPNDGILASGSSYPITWTSSDDISYVNIQLLDNLNNSAWIVTGLGNPKIYQWQVDNKELIGKEFKIRLTGYTNNYTLAEYDFSDNFFTISSSPTPTPTKTPSTVIIAAAGDASGGIYPTMKLRFNGTLIKQWTNIRGNPMLRIFNYYSIKLPRAIQKFDRIDVAFTNDDRLGGSGNRRLRINKITVDNIIYQAESAAVYSTGTWWSTLGKCSSRYAKSEWLHCNGAFTFLF